MNWMVLGVVIHCFEVLKLSPGHHWGGASHWRCRQKKKKEFLCSSVFEWGTKNGLELDVACLSVMFIAVKFWNFVGLICHLFARRGFKNWLAWLVPAPQPPYRRKRGIAVCISPVGLGGLVYLAFRLHSLFAWSSSHPQWSIQPGAGSVRFGQCLPGYGDPIYSRLDLTRDR